MNDEEIYSVDEAKEALGIKDIKDDVNMVPTYHLAKKKTSKKKPKKDTRKTKDKLIELLTQLEGNVRGRGTGANQIKEIKELAKQTTIKKKLNDGVDWIAMAVGRKWYAEIYERIGELKGLVGNL